MIRRFFYSFVFLIFSFSVVSGQDYGSAVAFSYEKTKVDTQFASKLVNDIISLGDKNLVVYNWESEKHALEKISKQQEKPVEFAIFIEQNNTVKISDKPDVQTKLDTTGRVIDAWFSFGFNMNYKMKIIDVKTGIVENIANISSKDIFFLKNKNYSIKIDYKKYFGSRNYLKLKKNKKSYNAVLLRLYRDYKRQISDTNSTIVKDHMRVIETVKNRIAGATDSNVYELTIDDINAKKIKRVTINAGRNKNVKKDQLFHIYSTVNVNEKDYLVKVASIQTKDVMEDKSSCTSHRMFAKKFATTLRDYNKFYVIKNEIALRKHHPEFYKDNLNISLAEANCLFCNYKLQVQLVRSPTINLIERASEELNILRALYKDERFIDGNLSELQDKQVGAQYILSLDGTLVNLTDVATGKMVAIDKKKGKLNWLVPGFTTEKAWKMALLEVAKSKIEFIKATKEKKNKIIKANFFHPLGFKRGDVFDILVVESEVVGGKTVERKSFIAVGSVRTVGNANRIAELKISDGKKELYKAVKDGKKLVITYHVKRD